MGSGRILGLIIIYFFAVNVNAQKGSGSFVIRGNVIEETSENSLQYVNVVVYAIRDSSLVTGTITDSKGRFEIVLNRPGKYFVTADFIGYEKQVLKQVTLNPSNSAADLGTIVLKQARLGIDAVEVVSEKPFVSYKLDRKVVEVSRNPSAQGGTAVDALENVPSIDIDIEGNVAVRGSTDFTVLIDGRQSPLTGSDALNQIPASAINQIEIITNPSAKYDPDGTAGIINIVTKKGKLKGHSLVANSSVGSSPLLSGDVSYAYRSKKATYSLSTGFRDSDMSFEHVNKRTNSTIDSITGDEELSYINTTRSGQMTRGNYFVKGVVDYQLSESNVLSVGGNYNNYKFARNFESKTNSISFDTNQYDLSKTQFSVNPESWQINIGDKHIFGDNKDHYLSADLLYQWRENEAVDQLNMYAADENWQALYNSAPYRKAITNENARRSRLEVNYSLPLGEDDIFESGYTYRFDTYEQDYKILSKTDEEGNDWYEDEGSLDTANFDRTIHAAWAVLKGQRYGIQYSFGLRLEHTDRNIETKKDEWDYNYNYLGWYPTISLAKEWESGHLLQTSYSKRINRPRDYHLNPFPGLSDGYTQFKPNPELEPEYAHAVELNYQKKWGASFIAVETFYRYTDNEMDRITEVSGDTLIRTIINLGYEENIGTEIALNYKIAKWWTFNPAVTLSYTKSEGMYDNSLKTVSSGNYRGSMVNNFFLPTKTRIQLMSYYRGARTEIDGTREPTFWHSAAVRQDFFDRKLSATLRVDDIFSTRKREGYTYAESTTIYSRGQRKSPTFVLSLSYKINPNSDRKRNGRNGNGGDGMDMDF